MIKDYATAVEEVTRRCVGLDGEQVMDFGLEDLREVALLLDGDADKARLSDRVRVYKGRDGQWRWKRVAPNNETIAIGGEGYVNKSYAVTISRACCPDLGPEAFTVAEWDAS